MRLPPYWSIKRNLKIQLLEHLVHQALVLDGQAHGGLCVIPTGIGRVLLGPALETPSTATGPAIRYLSGRDRRASARRARPRGPGVPVLNPEENLAIRVLGPLCPDPALQGLGRRFVGWPPAHHQQDKNRSNDDACFHPVSLLIESTL